MRRRDRQMTPETGGRVSTSPTACQVCGIGSRSMLIRLLKMSFLRLVIRENRASGAACTCQEFRNFPTLIFEWKAVIPMFPIWTLDWTQESSISTRVFAAAIPTGARLLEAGSAGKDAE